jgi:hypothetical protein
MPRKCYADGFVIVRDDADGAVYLHRDGDWATTGREARVFDLSIHARQWMRSRPLGYWLGHPAGRARIISARAAGVTR